MYLYSANCFLMAWESGIQVSFPFFVFAWHWKTDLNFAYWFSFLPNFEKRIWTLFFVHQELKAKNCALYDGCSLQIFQNSVKSALNVAAQMLKYLPCLTCTELLLEELCTLCQNGLGWMYCSKSSMSEMIDISESQSTADMLKPC